MVVSLNDNSNSNVVSSQSSRVLVNPLSLSSPDVSSVKKRGGGSSSKSRARVQRRLPTWWPTLVTRGAFMEYEEEYRRDAYRLVRGIDILFLSLPHYIYFTYKLICSLIIIYVLRVIVDCD